MLAYSIVTQAGETEPFYMTPSTGQIFLRSVLTGTNKNRYQVISSHPITCIIVKSGCSIYWLRSLSPRNSVGGDIVTRPFVGGWVSEWVRGWLGGWVRACVRTCVCVSVTLYLVDKIATTVFAQSLSNFTCKLWMMRGGTLLILGHGVKGQRQLWHSMYKTLWAR